MNLLRTFGWSLLLTSWLAGGCAPHGEAGLPQKGGRIADGGARTPAPTPEGHPAAADDLPRGWPWVADDEDEFEGEGWTFWPLAGPRR